jgi:hypothetical protein
MGESDISGEKLKEIVRVFLLAILLYNSRDMVW